jgi:23S rRNA (uridine2552-2'-O)-methyltransferase
MSVWFVPQDYYFKQAKKDGFVARSAYKLEEIDQKFKIFWPKTISVIDIGCAPGSRLQYVSHKLKSKLWIAKVIGLDLKKVPEQYPCVVTYQQDITDQDAVRAIMNTELWIKATEQKISPMVDVIISDMAPDTVGDSSTDAMRSINLIYDTMWMYHELLKPDGKFVIKIFMGPGFEQFVSYCRQHRGTKNIKIFKPKSCRSISKETYIVKI